GLPLGVRHQVGVVVGADQLGRRPAVDRQDLFAPLQPLGGGVGPRLDVAHAQRLVRPAGDLDAGHEQPVAQHPALAEEAVELLGGLVAAVGVGREVRVALEQEG
ncbi:hypothetical protein RZS08_63190, partial [Arthrospira platensis SPKY1]|nr:hypothetical protein [Arthrospira platensis SPKY1]